MRTKRAGTLNEYYEVLEWDSDFFGFSVARIIPSRLRTEQLTDVLNSLRKERVRLVYWASDPDDKESQQAALLNNGRLVDRKMFYVADLRKKTVISRPETGPMIEEYPGTRPDRGLVELAIQSGAYSRFNRDDNFPKKLFKKLYERWIDQSVNRIIADAVFVAKMNDAIVGMITVKKKGLQGQIGLIAVERAMRGNKIGTRLISAAHDWYLKQGCRTACVVTQADNIAGRKLYSACGYTVDRTEYFYHFWLSI